MKQAAKQLCEYASISLVRMPGTTGKHHAGCSKRLSSKAAAREEARRTLRYVEPLSAARTPLEDFFSILLGPLRCSPYNSASAPRIPIVSPYYCHNPRSWHP